MKTFEEMIECSTVKHGKKIKEFCEPIKEHFGISYFWHYKLTNEGLFHCFGSHIEWMKYYYANKLYLYNPFLRHPSFFTSGINLIRKVNNPSFQESLDFGKKLFNVDLSLVTIEKSINGIQGFGFATCLDNDIAETMYLAEFSKLSLFANRFRKEFSHLIEITNREPVDLATEKGTLFVDDTCGFFAKPKNIKGFLKKLNIDLDARLTSREMEVCFFLIQGFSASQIALQLFLSKRTIEHTIENIKDKLDCWTKAELIQKLIEREKLGF